MYTQDFRLLAANLLQVYECSAYNRHHAAKFRRNRQRPKTPWDQHCERPLAKEAGWGRKAQRDRGANRGLKKSGVKIFWPVRELLAI
jgi:hypothetical protein